MLEKNSSQALVNKWEPILEGIDDGYVRETTAVLLENQARHVLAEQSKSGILSEGTEVGNLGTFQKFAFPLVRRVFPELIANKVVGVQPMQGPVSQVFYLGFDRATGPDGAGAQAVYGKYLLTYRGANPNALASDGLGVNIDLSGISFSGQHDTVGVTGGGADISSTDGLGIAAFPSSTTLSQWNTSAGERMGSGNKAIPEINFHIEQQAVIATTRKFRALWTIEAAQDLRAYHNLDLERELTDLLSKEVALEIDREILEDLRMIAYDVTGSVMNPAFQRGMLDLGNPNAFPHVNAGAHNDYNPSDWNYNFTNGTNEAGQLRNVYFVDLNTTALNLTPRHVGESYSNLVGAVNFAAQDIYKTTFRGAGNWIITSPLVAAMLHTAAKLEGGMTPDQAGSLGANITYKGKWLGQYDVYIDPLWPEDEILMGYKGSNAMEGGYIYAPYIPIQMLPTIVSPDTFQPRKGLLTRYGKAVITPESRWYRIIRLVGANSRFLTQPFRRIENTFQTDADGVRAGSGGTW